MQQARVESLGKLTQVRDGWGGVGDTLGEEQEVGTKYIRVWMVLEYLFGN